MQSSYVCPPPACSPCIYTCVRAHLCMLWMKMGGTRWAKQWWGKRSERKAAQAGGGRAQEAQDVVYKTVSCTSPL